MIIEEITLTAFQQHTRIVGCPTTKMAICIDPGNDSDRILAAVENHFLKLQAIALTHAHLDHVGGVSALKARVPEAKIIIHPLDEPLYKALPEQPLWVGIPREQWPALGFDYDEPPAVDEYWQDNQHYAVGNLDFTVLHCPGHTPGHVVLLESSERKIFVGDCLFAGSVGRTDLPGGSTDQLLNSIMNKILPVGDDVEVYSGHGPVTTIGQERANNPYLQGFQGRGTRF